MNDPLKMKRSATVAGMLLWLAIATGCRPQAEKACIKTDTDTVSSKQQPASIPVIQVYTIGKVSDKVRDRMMDSLRLHYPQCEFIKNIPLPKEAYYAPRKRYLADKLNAYLSTFKKDENVVVGLTQADISLNNFRNSPNFGIMGMAHGLGNHVAVFSDFRCKDYSDFSELVQHELAHAFGLPHCPDKTCIMQNAEGGNKFRTSSGFCPKCKDFLKKKNWKL